MSFLPISALLLNQKWMRLASPYFNEILKCRLRKSFTEVTNLGVSSLQPGQTLKDVTSLNNQPRDLDFYNWQRLHLHFSYNYISLDISNRQLQVLFSFNRLSNLNSSKLVEFWPLQFSYCQFKIHRTAPKSTNRIIFLFFEFCDLSL